jgi:OH-DDVA oxygenase
MAEIVLGIGSSHGPLLSTPPEQWDLRAKADRENKNHWFRGKTYDYTALLQERAPGFADEIVVEKRRERFVKCRSALEALGRKFNEVAPDAVVIIGNDQREFFNSGLTPAITVYRGKTISNVQHLNEDQPGLNIAEPANSPEDGATYPGATELADHIVRSLGDENFDLAQSDQTPSGSRMRTGSSTTRFCRTRRRQACRSSSTCTSRTTHRKCIVASSWGERCIAPSRASTDSNASRSWHQAG